MYKDSYFSRKLSSSSIHSFIKSASRCAICNSFGHISSQCFKVLKKCIYCADSSHSYPKCPDNLCNLCNLPGHTLKNCSYPNRCILCNIAGHDDSNCFSSLTPCNSEDCDQVTCLNCREKGHANCTESKQNLTHHSNVCNQCHQIGHSFSNCIQNKKKKKSDLIKKHVKQNLIKLNLLILYLIFVLFDHFLKNINVIKFHCRLNI